LGHVPIADVARHRWQLLVDDLTAAGASSSTVRSTVTTGRALWRHAIRRGTVASSPLDNLELPDAGPGRDRIVPPEEAAELIAALPADLQPLYGLAYFAGPRRGEILALDVADVRDPESEKLRDVVSVTKSWDATARTVVQPKSKAGTREVELVTPLRAMLLQYLMRTGRREGPLFGNENRLDPRGIARRAAVAWRRENAERAEGGLEPVAPVGLHELRHGYGSMMIAAGADATTVAEQMGHADGGALLLGRYSHAMPDAGQVAARKLEAFLNSRSS
jgi:integrase